MAPDGETESTRKVRLNAPVSAGGPMIRSCAAEMPSESVERPEIAQELQCSKGTTWLESRHGAGNCKRPLLPVRRFPVRLRRSSSFLHPQALSPVDHSSEAGTVIAADP